MKDFSSISIADAAVGFPARLCVLTCTDGTVYRFVEADGDIVVDGDTYSAVPGLEVSAVTHTRNGEMPSCQIVAYHSPGSTFDTEDLDIGLFDSAVVQIYLVNLETLATPGLLFTGAVATISYDVDSKVVFDVKGPAVSAKRLMTQKRSPMCRTLLGSTLCGVDLSSYDVSTTVALIDSNFSFTVTGSLAQATGYFNGGVALNASGRPFVIANWDQPSQTITAFTPCRRLIAEGGTLTLYPGCDKTMGVGGCPKFSNQENFQGEPHFLGTAAAAQQV